MEAAKRPGVIINLGSASGLYPMFFDPIYSGSKGLLFTSFDQGTLLENKFKKINLWHKRT